MQRQIDVTEMYAVDMCYKKINTYMQKELGAYPLYAVECGLEKALLDIEKTKSNLYTDVIAKQNKPKEEQISATSVKDTVQKLRECGVKVVEK